MAGNVCAGTCIRVKNSDEVGLQRKKNKAGDPKKTDAGSGRRSFRSAKRVEDNQ